MNIKGLIGCEGGEDLIPMTPDLLKRIFDEVGLDFTAEVCKEAKIDDLDPGAIELFRGMWLKKSGNARLDLLTIGQLLADSELIVNGCLTIAALIMFGTREALGRYLSQVEVIFEYRSSEVSGPSQQREEYRQGFFIFIDDLWSKINLRNEMQHFQDGLFIWDIPTFNEVVVREAILNAIAHRDYRLGGSIFIRQYSRKLEIVSPGGFPPGITPENILWRQLPRNRRIAESLARCGLVERSGQGVNRMFEECIKESKPRPDFSNSDDYQVSVLLGGEVQDPNFLRFLEKIGREKLATFATEDFLTLDLINREEPILPSLRSRLPHLVEHGIIEKIGRGKGVRYILSRQFYKFIGKKGVYTRKRGLDHGTNKMLLLKHIQENQKEGSKFRELKEVLPSLSRGQIQTLLKELKKEGQIHHVGSTRAAIWYPGPKSN